MKRLNIICTVVFAVIMILAGLMHFIKPHIYYSFIPDWLPKNIVNYITGVIEIFLGMASLMPRSRTWGTLGILFLMLAFLPLHTLDLFKQHPAIGSHQAALIRFPIQFVLIFWAWFIYKNSKEKFLTDNKH